VVGTTLLLLLAIVVAGVGIVGLAIPALPGAPLLFIGLVLAAWAEDFAYVGTGTLVVLAILALLTYAVDLAAGAFGVHSSPNPERGVYKTTDGGGRWDKVLFRDDLSGAVDISVHPSNPDIVYAALWEAWRKSWGASSGGPGSGLFRSTDGGENWEEGWIQRMQPGEKAWAVAWNRGRHTGGLVWVPDQNGDGEAELLRRPIAERIYFVNQDNWALPAVENCLLDAEIYAPQITAGL